MAQGLLVLVVTTLVSILVTQAATTPFPSNDWDNWVQSSSSTSPAGVSSSDIISSVSTTEAGATALSSGAPTSDVASATPSTNSNLTASPCVPAFMLDGANEHGFNPSTTTFNLKLSCGTLDTRNYTAFANGNVTTNTSNTTSSITFPGFEPGYTFMTVLAMDTSGYPIFQSFQLLFGSATLKVQVLDPEGQPAIGASVQANATTYNAIGDSVVTDAQGMAVFTNVPAITIGLVAKTADNQIAVNGIAGDSAATLTLQLLPLQKPTGASTFDAANGTSGWTGGLIEDIASIRRRARSEILKRDTSLVVSTKGLPTLQSAFASFSTEPSTTSVYLRYKFQTEEVPGGYFGSEFNDYFSVTIRADTGEYASVAHSMNELGLGAFNAAGATKWYTLSLDVLDATFVEFNVAISNVADELYNSKVIVQQAGQESCDKCDTCQGCPSNPMCQEQCMNPPPDSCNFYQSCAEAVIQCDVASYALIYGQRNCDAYQLNRDRFSPAGQNWVSASEQCLQKALIPSLTCDTTCAFIEAVGLDSISRCYIENGYCNLEAMDYVHILTTVGYGKIRDSLKIAIRFQADCASKVLSKINDAIQDKLSKAANNEDSEKNLEEAKALSIARVFHTSTITDGPLSDVVKAITYVQEIYDTATLYNKEKVLTLRTPNQLTMEWMRHLKYDDFNFKALIGFIDQDFIMFASEHGLPFYDSYPDPSFPGTAIEFDHLGATMDAVYRSSDGVNGDIGGWLGDLFTFYHDWQVSGVTSGRDFCLSTLAQPGDTSSYKLQDAIEDADGCNMAVSMRNNFGRTIVEEFKTLLEGGGHANRWKTFMDSQFKGSKAEAAKVACDYLTQTFLDSPTVKIARGALTQRGRASVTPPEKLPRVDLNGFCDGFGEVIGGLAGVN